MEITRTSILREVLTDKEEQMFKYSKFRAGLTPLEGYEKVFEDLRKTCDLLREMLREQLAGPQQPLADWQMEIIRRDAEREEDGPIRRMMVGGEKMTPDEAILRRRHQKAEGFKPEPVVYPGGEE